MSSKEDKELIIEESDLTSEWDEDFRKEFGIVCSFGTQGALNGTKARSLYMMLVSLPYQHQMQACIGNQNLITTKVKWELPSK